MHENEIYSDIYLLTYYAWEIYNSEIHDGICMSHILKYTFKLFIPGSYITQRYRIVYA